MSGAIVLSPQAEADPDAAAAYFARASGELAVRFYRSARRSFGTLAAHPRIGRARNLPDSVLEIARSWPAHGFESVLSFYRPFKAGIRILRVLHGARDPGTELGET